MENTELQNYYEKNPELNIYWETLPLDIRAQLLQSNIPITTLGELKKCAEHFKQVNLADAEIHS